MRELRGAGVVNVILVTGDTNPADMFTKIVSKQLFDKYRKFVTRRARGAVVDEHRAPPYNKRSGHGVARRAGGAARHVG